MLNFLEMFLRSRFDTRCFIYFTGGLWTITRSFFDGIPYRVLNWVNSLFKEDKMQRLLELLAPA